MGKQLAGAVAAMWIGLAACAAAVAATTPGSSEADLVGELTANNDGTYAARFFCTRGRHNGVWRACDFQNYKVYFDIHTLEVDPSSFEPIVCKGNVGEEYAYECRYLKGLYNEREVRGQTVRVLDADKVRPVLEALMTPVFRQRVIADEMAQRGDQAVLDVQAAADGERFKGLVLTQRQAAAARFQQEATRSKEVGMTVCSADNRLGYVEQVAGPRIKVEVRAIAAAHRDAPMKAKTPAGPFEVDMTALSITEIVDRSQGQQMAPVKDPNYLFQPVESVQLLAFNRPTTVWDESTAWGVCSWKA